MIFMEPRPPKKNKNKKQKKKQKQKQKKNANKIFCNSTKEITFHHFLFNS